MSYLSLTKEEEARMHPVMTVRCVMMSGDSPPPPLRASGPQSSPGFDTSDDVKLDKNSPTGGSVRGKIMRSNDDEMIEEIGPIIEKMLPAPEPRPNIERNELTTYDIPDGKKLVDNDEIDNDSCVIKCLSFTQQCCDCTIL